MEQKIPKISIKSRYFIISTILLILLASAIVFVPQQTWKRIFSGKFFHFAAVFRSNDFQSGFNGNWNEADTWNGPLGEVTYYAPAPSDIDISSTGEIFVADYGRVFVLNPDGTASTTYLMTFNINGDDSTLPGITIFQDEIYTVGILNEVNILSMDGISDRTYNGGSYTPMSPYSIFISNVGYIYIADTTNNRVVVLNSDGTASTTYPSISPNDVVVSDDGYIYIAEPTSITILNPNGTASTTYNGDSFAPISPNNIAISDSGYIYISEYNNSRIVVLNSDGTASTTYNGGAYAPILPRGIKISQTGEIYISDSDNSRVVVLNSDGTASTTYNISYSPEVDVDFPGANSDVTIINDTVTLTQDENVHNLDIFSEGTLDLSGFNLNVFGSYSNNGGTIIENGGFVNMIDFSTDLTVDSPITLSEDTYVNNLTLVSGGTLDLDGYTIYVVGDWNNTGGEFISNGGTVNMISTTTQQIIGATTFENLKKITNVQSSLLFDSSTTTTITDNLILKGIDENLLTIAPIGSAYEFVSKIGGIDSYLQGISFDISSSSEKIYVAGSNNNRIDVLNLDGTVLTSYNGDTFAPISPSAIAVSETTGEIYFADFNSNNNVYVLNPDGTASTSYTFTGGSVGIYGLDVSPSGVVYIADLGNKLIILNPDGTTATTTTITIGGYNPIALSRTGELYVYNGYISTKNKITVLNPNGTASTTIYGATPPNISYSGGIAVSDSGEIYLGDTNNSNIIILNPDGTASSSLSIIGAPFDLMLSPSGQVLVLNIINNNHRYLLSYELDGSLSSNFDILNEGKLVNPYGLIKDSLGNIYISDTSFKNIQKFDNSGNFIKFFDTVGPSILFDPRNLAVDSSNNIYVADSGHVVSGVYTGGKIVKFDSDGNYLSSVAIDTLLPDTANLPRSVAVDDNGFVYVASENGGNSNLARVLKLNSDLTLNLSVNTTYGGNPYFYPEGLKLNPSQSQLYITEDNNADIVILNISDLSFVSISTGPIEYPFTTPNGLTFDSLGNIFVSDGEGYILKLDSNFGFIASFGLEVVGDGRDGEVGQYIKQIITDSNDDVYIADPTNNRVQKFTEADFSPFQIIHTNPTSNNINLSYLAVSGSNNISSSPFICINGCTNGGFNSNWTFATIPSSGGKRSRPVSLPVIYTTEFSATNTPSLDSISISPLNQNITTQPTITFISTTLDQFGNPFATTTSWISLNPLIGTINSSGIFTPLSAGITTITATAGRISTSTTITVHQNLTSISLSPLNPNIRLKEKIMFSSTKLDQFGHNFATTTHWASSNTSIGTISSSGLFTANNKKGTTIITASVGNLSTSTLVTVTAPRTSVEIATTTEENEINESTPAISTSTASLTNIITNNPTSSQNNIVSNIGNSIVQGFQNSIITAEDIENVREIVTSDIGSAVTKTISTVGIVAGAGASIGAVAFASPIAFAELWLIPAKLFGLLMGALGTRRKNRAWGTVYDSVTKRPLDPVYVSLIDVNTNKEVASAITDIDGRYGFLVLPGKYRVEVKKTNYISPSVKMHGKAFDEVYNDLYFGSELIVEKEGQMITKNIPMDSQSFDWNEFAKTKMNVNSFTKGKDITWAKISKILFGFGAIVSFIALIFAPAPYNSIIAIFYVLAYIFNFVVLKNKKAGTLLEKNTNVPLSFAIVKIFREGEDSPLTKKIADKFGAYYALVPKGKYYIEIDAKKNDGNYNKVFKTEVMEIDTGIINMNFVV